MTSNTQSEPEEKIAEIRERLAAATPVCERNLMAYDHGGGRLTIETPRRALIADFYDAANRDFYTRAYADVSWLLEQLNSIPSQISEAVKAEREACADLAEGMMVYPPLEYEYCTNAASKVAAAIRARAVHHIPDSEGGQ